MKYFHKSAQFDIKLQEASTYQSGPTTFLVDGCKHQFFEATPTNDAAYDQMVKAAIEDHLKYCVSHQYDEEMLGLYLEEGL